MSEGDKLTIEQAISVLSEGDEVHTYLNEVPGKLVGADWPRFEVIDTIYASGGATLAGPLARKAGHGIAVYRDGLRVFVATDEKALAAFPLESASVAQ